MSCGILPSRHGCTQQGSGLCECCTGQLIFVLWPKCCTSFPSRVFIRRISAKSAACHAGFTWALKALYFRIFLVSFYTIFFVSRQNHKVWVWLYLKLSLFVCLFVCRSSRCLPRGRPQQAIFLRRWMRRRAAASGSWGRRRATTLIAKATWRTWPGRTRVGPHSRAPSGDYSHKSSHFSLQINFLDIRFYFRNAKSLEVLCLLHVFSLEINVIKLI